MLSFPMMLGYIASIHVYYYGFQTPLAKFDPKFVK